MFYNIFIVTFIHLFFIKKSYMPENQITDNIPFDGNFYRFVCALHGLKGIVDILVDDAHNRP